MITSFLSRKFAFSLCISLLITSFSLVANEKPLPIKYFAKHGDYLDLKLSPDGKHIAARLRNGDSVYLIILDTESMEIINGVKPQEKDIIHTVNWVNNERLVFEYAEKQHYFDQPIPTGELFATNVDGSNRRLIYGYRAGDERTGSRMKRRDDDHATQEILSLLANDDDEILIMEHPWSQEGNYYYDNRKRLTVISRLNINNGRKVKIETLPERGATALADKYGNVKFMRWLDEQNNYHSAFRNNQEDEWQDLSTVFGFEKNLAPRGISDDGKIVYLSGAYSDNGIFTFYQLDIENKSLHRIFGDHKTDIETIVKDANNVPAVGITYPARAEYVYAKANSKTKGIHKMLAEAFQDQTVSITSRTKDGKTLLVHVSSDVNPGEYYLFDRDTLNASFIWANRSWIDPRTMAEKQPFKFTTKDNVELNGYLTLPVQKREQKPPMVVMIHGGPHQPGTRDYWDFDSEVQMLANYGFAVMQVNFRGSDGYGRKFTRMGYGEWGGKMIDDVIESTQWVIDQGYVDSDRVCVFGASYGGYAALMSAVKAPDMYQCTVGYAGIYDLELMFTESDIPDAWGGMAYLKKVLGTNKQKLQEYSPAFHVEKLKANVMLIHGAQDRRTPEINAEVLQEKLDKVGKEATLLRFRQSGHGVYDEESRTDLYQGLIEFLQQNLMQDSSSNKT